MKASFSVVLALAGACLAVRAEAQTVVVGPSTSSMALVSGTQVTVPIVADLSGSGGASLGSIAARLLWHPSVLAFRGVSAGTLGAAMINADSAGGSLRFALANPVGATGQPVLVNVIFSVVGAAGATDTLRVNLEELNRAGTFADLLPIGAATTSLACVATGVFGDLDAGGTVTSADALAIVTSAVGLPLTAPFTTVNGDVDGNGRVDTRDALIVLSYVVGLPVTGFRVARLNGGACAVQMPASVQILPGGVAVVTGDRFPLSAVVRDSGGAVVSGIGLVWTSADTLVVKADATGDLLAVGPGTAKVFANAAPGLKDSVTVTVFATRHTWYVNPAVAALNAGTELGSSAYPFSSIGQALARAAANDSVMIAPATYGEVVFLGTPLTLVGDSTAAGATIIRNPAGPGIFVDIPEDGGLVRIDHLRIEDSQGGVVAQGPPTGVVILSRIGIVRSRGAGITASGMGSLLLDHSAVQGAAGQAIAATGVRVVRLHAVAVDGVTEVHVGGNMPPLGVWVTGTDSLVAENLTVTAATVLVDSARVARFAWFNSNGAPINAIRARVGSKFTIDSGTVRDVQKFGLVDPNNYDVLASAIGLDLAPGATARVADVVFDHNPGGALTIQGGDSVLVSGVQVHDSPFGNSYDWFAALFTGQRRAVLEHSVFQDNADAPVIFWQDGELTMHATVDTAALTGTRIVAQGLAQVEIRRSRVSNTRHGAAVLLEYVGTATLDRLEQQASTPQPYFDDPHSSGLYAVEINEADSVQLRGLALHDNLYGALVCRNCRAVDAASSSFLRNGQAASALQGIQLGTLVLEGTTQAHLVGLQVDGGGFAGLWLRGPTGGSRIVVDSSAFGGQAALISVDLSDQYGYTTHSSVAVTHSAFHGRNLAGGYGVLVAGTGFDSIEVSGSTFDSTDAGVVFAQYGAVYSAAISGNTFTGMGQGALQANFYTWPVFDSNTVAGCVNAATGDAVHLEGTGGQITRNVIHGCLRGVWAENGGRLDVVGNVIGHDSTYTSYLVDITGRYDSVVVAGNLFQGGRGTGLAIYGNAITGARVDSNTVQGILGDGITLDGSITNPVQMLYNVIADNDANGLWTSVPVSGQYNTIVRNAGGGATLMGGSTFRLGNYVGNGHNAVTAYSGGPIVADSSFWGGATGPRCATGCDVAGGDSVGPNVTFLPFDTTLVVGAPPIPNPLPAPAPAFGAPSARPVSSPRVPVRPMAAATARPTMIPAARPTERPRPSTPIERGRVRP